MDLSALLTSIAEGNRNDVVADLLALPASDLQALTDAIRADYREIYPPGTRATPEIVTRLGQLSEAFTVVQEVQQHQAAITDASSLLDAVNTNGNDGQDPGADDDDAEPDGEPATPPPPPANPPGTPPPAPAELQPQTPPADGDPAALEGELITATATARRSGVNLDALRGRSVTPPAGPDNRGGLSYRFTVAENIPGFGVGSRIQTRQDLVQAVIARMKAMPAKGTPGYVKAGIASIERVMPEQFQLKNTEADADVIDRVADEHRLPGGSLVAANGWCVPSTVEYDLCPSLLSDEGMVNLPTTQLTRGGTRYPSGWDYQSIAALLPGQVLCEADMEAGTQKQCIEVGCPDWDEIRECVIPLCVINPILQQRTWPEGIARFIDDVVDAQAHFTNAWFIQQMVANSTAATPMANMDMGATHQTLDQFGLLVTWFQDYYRAPMDFTLEVVLPHWLRQMLIADIAKRLNGNTEIAEQQLDDYFRRRRTLVQWVYDWQPLATGTGTPPVFNPPATWPATVTALVYPAGTFVRSVSNVINLSGVYDSTLIRDNKYLGLFTEDAVALVPRCYRSYTVQIPLCISGAMGPEVNNCPAA